MIEALLSFLGGSAFRMIWGEVSSYFTKKQDHAHEVERMRLQATLDAEAHARTLQGVKLQADLGVKTIQVQAEADLDRIAGEGWLEAVKATGRSIGVAWIDAWNASIRPGVATWAVVMLSLESLAGMQLSDGTTGVCYGALGLFLADRTLGKRGK
jgi:hypothetical protein